MANTNHFSGIVKILENPKEYSVNGRARVTQFRVEIPQKRKNTLVSLLIWGNLGRDVKKFYKVNDYILIEGYSSIRAKSTFKSTSNNLRQISITVLRVYPILLDTNRSFTKI